MKLKIRDFDGRQNRKMCDGKRRFAALLSSVLVAVFVFATPIRAQESATMIADLPTIPVEFSAPIYTSSDGALTVQAGGDYVDPYFATKALLAARSTGLDIRAAGERWVSWMLPRQNANGLFSRFQRVAPGVWRVVAPADADDAILALWIELLYTLAPESGLPAAWQKSVRRAQQRLDELRNTSTGVYNISATMPVALLMDNVEIYGSLQNMAVAQMRMNQSWRALQTRAKMQTLAANINAVFWRNEWNEYSISTQEIARDSFYPYAVAQIYPLAEAMPSPLTQNRSAREAYDTWISQHQTPWLEFSADHYPWGLVALTGMLLGDSDTAYSWLTAAAPLRYSTRWNVLEEAIFQGLDAQI